MTSSVTTPAATPAAGTGWVVVVGTGLVGASIGMALTASGRDVHLRDQTISHARVAAGLGAGTLAEPAADDVSLVVVAVPPAAIAGVVVASLAQYPRATVTDVGSVKAGVLDTVWRYGDDLGRYVGSHPMAGSQHSGPVTARADLFDGRTWVVAPHRRSEPASVQRVVGLVEACQAHLVLMDVDDHDAAVARVSHLPHLMSVLMAGHLTSVGTEDLLLAGQGLRDVTRVAGSDPGLWEQILSANSTAVLAELRTVSDELSTLIKAVEAGAETDELRSHLARGVEGTRRIPGKHGAAPVSYAQVVVEIPDTPGALGRLFAHVGECGVNVEDIAIEHDQARQIGYLALSVSPPLAPELRAAMLAGGWSVAG
ncbi:prephenate dehydrogenase [uncultured Friedmanniella sp.]|uniref:prephenate dehydrogenase n=1 Tax=uncultured Friedmanniella sp. TaxID=335381 RepID=UPI0035C9FCDD